MQPAASGSPVEPEMRRFQVTPKAGVRRRRRADLCEVPSRPVREPGEQPRPARVPVPGYRTWRRAAVAAGDEAARGGGDAAPRRGMSVASSHEGCPRHHQCVGRAGLPARPHAPQPRAARGAADARCAPTGFVHPASLGEVLRGRSARGLRRSTSTPAIPGPLPTSRDVDPVAGTGTRPARPGRTPPGRLDEARARRGTAAARRV